MTLKAFRPMLLWAKLIVHTDHKNLTFNNLQTQYLLRWRCSVEEYSPTIQYIEGPENVIADTFSRLHRKDGDSDTQNAYFTPFVTSSIQLHNNIINTIKDHYYSLTEDYDMVECFCGVQDDGKCSDLFESNKSFLNLPNVAHNDSPLNFVKMKEKKQKRCRGTGSSS